MLPKAVLKKNMGGILKMENLGRCSEYTSFLLASLMFRIQMFLYVLFVTVHATGILFMYVVSCWVHTSGYIFWCILSIVYVIFQKIPDSFFNAYQRMVIES